MWAGDMHWVKGARPLLARSQSESQERWQSQWRLLECRRLWETWKLLGKCDLFKPGSHHRSQHYKTRKLTSGNPEIWGEFFSSLSLCTQLTVVSKSGKCRYTLQYPSHFPKVCQNMTPSERTHSPFRKTGGTGKWVGQCRNTQSAKCGIIRVYFRKWWDNCSTTGVSNLLLKCIAKHQNSPRQMWKLLNSMFPSVFVYTVFISR